MAKILSKTKVYIGQGVAPGVAPGADTFDSIGNLISSSGPEISKDEIEITDMESTVKEFLGDLANPGSISGTCNRNFGDVGQTNARDDSLGSTLRNIRVERLDSSLAVEETMDAIGEVMEWNEDAAQASPFTITWRIKLTSTPVFT